MDEQYIILIMKKNIILILAIIFVVVLVERTISATSFFDNLELMTYDMRARFTSETKIFDGELYKSDKDIVIVAIDDYSKKQLQKNPRMDLGPWPWHRDAWNEVVEFIEQGKPKALMFDLVFENLNENSWNDRRFAQVLNRYDNIILGTFLDNPKVKDTTFTKMIDIEPNKFTPTSSPLDVTVDDKKLDDNITYYTNAPVHDIYSQSNMLGVVNRIIDTDSEVRKTQPIYKLEKDGETYYMPSLSFAGFLEYMGEKEPIKIKNKKILYKGRTIPIDKNGILTLNWRKSKGSYDYIPISKILLNNGEENELRPEFFKDKLVIIGQTAVGKNLNMESFVKGKYTGPEAVALSLDNLINDTYVKDASVKNFITEVPKPVQFLITILACSLVAFLCMVSKSAFIGCLNGILMILLYVILSFWLFTNPTSKVWIPIVVPLYYLTLTSALVSAYRFYKEITKKACLMNVFGKFVSPKVLSSVMKNPEKMVLKNSRKKITVLFCDVKDFSRMSEKYDPEKLIENLNELFKEVVNVIFENNGVVDKFIGDCIMAYWGDLSESDNDAFLAVKTALEIKKKVDELKIKNALEGKIIFDVKIGINTGEAVLGITGTDKIMSYTAMGDAVNTASRLENACSSLNKSILVSKSTYDESKDKIIALEAGEILVKGKENKIRVYEPIGLIDDSNQEAQESSND